MPRSTISPASVGLVLLSLLSVESHVAHAAETAVWTLDAAVRQALTAAPETRAATAEVAAREGALKQAGAWPNPSVDLRAEQKPGIEDGRGGADLTLDITLSGVLLNAAYSRVLPARAGVLRLVD